MGVVRWQCCKKNLTIVDLGITWLAKKTSEKFGNVMWVLWGDYVTKCSLTIIDVNITWLAKNINDKFGRLMWVLWGEDNV